ncbi:hypothetical protein MATL_G00220870, partial [Megalops atlanticus]
KAGTYTCEVKNSISNETASITVGKECTVAVSKPTISKEGGSCSFLCTVERGTEANLSWYRDGQTKSISRTLFRNTPMGLALTAHKGGKYTCEVKNSISRENNSITVGKECTGNRAGAAPATGHFSVLSCFFVLILVQFFL